MATQRSSFTVELDSHAQSAVVGKDALILRDTKKSCSVTGFTNSLGKVASVPIVDACVAYDDPVTGESYCLILYNALWVEEMDHVLIPPFLLRRAGLLVDECPKIQARNPTDETHSICFLDASLRIPLQLRGTFSVFNARCPTRDEWHLLPRMNLTSDEPNWDPHTDVFSLMESSMLGSDGYL